MRIATLALAALLAAPAVAQDHATMGHAAPGGEAASTAAFVQAMDKMHRDMMID